MGIQNTRGIVARKVKVEAWEGVSERAPDQRPRCSYFSMLLKVTFCSSNQERKAYENVYIKIRTLNNKSKLTLYRNQIINK